MGEGQRMDNGYEHAWKVSKDKLIREIESTYEAILKFKDISVKSAAELELLTEEELAAELQNQTNLLEQLVNKWEIRK